MSTVVRGEQGQGPFSSALTPDLLAWELVPGRDAGQSAWKPVPWLWLLYCSVMEQLLNRYLGMEGKLGGLVGEGIKGRHGAVTRRNEPHGVQQGPAPGLGQTEAQARGEWME